MNDAVGMMNKEVVTVPFYSTIPACLEEVRTKRKSSAKRASLQMQTWNWGLLNTNQECRLLHS